MFRVEPRTDGVSCAELDERLAAAGVDLGMMAIQWGTRPDRPPSIAVTRRDLQLLRFLHDFGYASTSTLAAFFWGKYGSAPRERLKLLHDAGLVDKLRPAVGRSRGASEWIYRLTAPGWRALTAWGEPADGLPFKPARLTSISYVEHDVQVAALLAIIAARAARACGRDGPLLTAAPFTIGGPRSGRIELAPADTSPGSYDGLSPSRSPGGTPQRPASSGLLEPDATLTGRTSDGKTTAVLIEYDRTRRPVRQADRLRRYDAFLNTGWRSSQHGELDIEPAVLFVSSDPRRIAGLARVADRALTGSSRHNGTVEYIGREQVGFTSRPQLAAGSDEISQLTPQPTTEPSRSSVVVRRQFCLDTLFRRPS